MNSKHENDCPWDESSCSSSLRDHLNVLECLHEKRYYRLNR